MPGREEGEGEGGHEEQRLGHRQEGEEEEAGKVRGVARPASRSTCLSVCPQGSAGRLQVHWEEEKIEVLTSVDGELASAAEDWQLHVHVSTCQFLDHCPSSFISCMELLTTLHVSITIDNTMTATTDSVCVCVRR